MEGQWHLGITELCLNVLLVRTGWDGEPVAGGQVITGGMLNDTYDTCTARKVAEGILVLVAGALVCILG